MCDGRPALIILRKQEIEMTDENKQLRKAVPYHTYSTSMLIVAADVSRGLKNGFIVPVKNELSIPTIPIKEDTNFL